MVFLKKTHKSLSAERVETIAGQLCNIIDQAKKIPGLDDGAFDSYQQICEEMPGLIQAGRLKIAVVGVIKSGKSTFVNCVLEKELVKRGAGVVTAITTRICKGNRNQACLTFKSWDEINAQIRDSFKLYPDVPAILGKEMEQYGTSLGNGDAFDVQSFDIRRRNDRACLEAVYRAMAADAGKQGWDNRPEKVLIHHALKGFDDCKDLVEADETCHCFQSKDFEKHQLFTADPDKAFYVKDVCLELYGKTVDPNIEIADCQGADSTDPFQLAKVLSYLETANLIIYCISSRTGLRQSDMTLLNRIEKLGLFDHLIFVNNCDLSEHENIEDMLNIETGILQDLSFLKIAPPVFSFSCLYHLFSSLESRLKARDKARLKLWQTQKKMTAYSREQFEAFKSLFFKIIEKDRNRLLVFNHLNRLEMIAKKMNLQVELFLDLLSADREREEQAHQKLEKLADNAGRLETLVSKSLSRSGDGLKEELASDIDLIFKQDGSGIRKKLEQFILQMGIDIEKYQPIVKQSGIKKIFYLIFQDFKQQIDLYLVEQILPEVKSFTQKTDCKIDEYFKSLFHSYKIDLIFPEEKKLPENENKESGGLPESLENVDINGIKKLMGLTLPPVLFEAAYSPVVKANVFSGFWFRNLSQIVSALFNKNTGFSVSPVLEKTIRQIKKENYTAVSEQMNLYAEKLVREYYNPLIEAAARDFEDKIDHRFMHYRSFRDDAVAIYSLDQNEKENRQKNTLSVKEQIKIIHGEIISIFLKLN